MKDLYIITGATGGMGYEAARHFIKDGKLLLLDLSMEALKEVEKELGGDADSIEFDITNSKNIEEVVSYVKKQGGFKYLLHFAGVSESMGNSELIYKINLIGTKKLLDGLYEFILPGGVVINTTSITAHLTPIAKEVEALLKDPLKEDFLTNVLEYTKATTQAYGWSKKGVLELTKAEGMKWGKKKSRIISISPGAIKTKMVEKEMEKNAAAINQLIGATPMNRIGMPEDIVNLVEFLISDKASFITGTDVIIDGGVTPVLKSFQK